MSKELDWVFIFLPFLPRGTGADKPGGRKRVQGFRLALLALLVRSYLKRLLTQVVLKLLGASVFRRGNQVPHEAFDFVVSSVMDQAVGQQSPADGLHVPLRQLLLKTPMVEDILPATPPENNEKLNFSTSSCTRL